MSKTEELYFKMKAQSKILKRTAEALSSYFGLVELRKIPCNSEIKRLIPVPKSTDDCKREIESPVEESIKEDSHKRSKRATNTGGTEITETTIAASTPQNVVQKLADLIYGHTLSKVTAIKARDYERTACLFDRVNAQKNQLTKVEWFENTPFELFKANLKTFLVKHFGVRSGRKQCYRTFINPDNQETGEKECITKMLVTYRDQFLLAMDTLKNSVRDGLKTRGSPQEDYQDFDFQLGEFADMYYRVYYHVVDIDSERANGFDEDCFACEEFGNCDEFNCDTANSRKGPQNINFAIFLHYSLSAKLKLKYFWP